MKDIVSIREDFPILKQKIYGHDLIYLDNAATTQLPKCVIDAWSKHYLTNNANVHRGIHFLSEKSTEDMERTRTLVSNFLNAEGQGEIVFTSGATDSANLVAQSYLKHKLKEGDVVLASELEHHSNFVVWQQLCKEIGASFKMIPTVDGEIDMQAFKAMLNENVRLVAVTLVSNVTGTVVDVDEIVSFAHKFGSPVYVDAAQGLRHCKIDLSNQDWDFAGFSAHKMMGPAGVGCLYIKNDFCKEMHPYRFGGGMVDIVEESDTSFAKVPSVLEAGTPNYSSIIAFGKSVEYINDTGLDEIINYEHLLTKKLETVLEGIDEAKILGHPKHRAGAVSFLIDGMHPYDAASILDKYGVAVRSGSMCAQPILRKMGTDSVIRVSPAFYNTEEEINAFGLYLKKTIEFLKKYS